jgi:hypothetical protein
VAWLQGFAGTSEIRDLIDEVRVTTAARILDGIYPDGARPRPAPR